MKAQTLNSKTEELNDFYSESELEYSIYLCKQNNSKILKTADKENIEIVFDTNNQHYEPTGQFVDLWVHINNYDKNNEPCNPEIYPVVQEIESDHNSLPQSLFRFNACIDQSGEKFIYAQELLDPDKHLWDSFECDLEELISDDIICPYHENYEGLRLRYEARNTITVVE